MITYSSEDVARHTGATPTQIEHYCRVGIVVPAEKAPRRGMSRRFDFANLVQIAIARRLANALGTPAIADILRRYCRPEQLTALKRSPKPILRVWFGAGAGIPHELGARLDADTMQALSGGPALVTAADVADRLTCDDEALLAINLSNVIAKLENDTGDSL
jgi:hypothetical protein